MFQVHVVASKAVLHREGAANILSFRSGKNARVVGSGLVAGNG